MVTTRKTAANLSELALLPDFHQELFVQKLVTEFHYFRKLPPELRIKIWGNALDFQKPRTINLSTTMILSPLGISTAPPALHWACIESRTESEKKNMILYLPFVSESLSIRMCINPSIDTVECNLFDLQFEHDQWLGDAGVGVEKIKRIESFERLIITTSFLYRMDTIENQIQEMTQLWKNIQKFTGLKKIIVSTRRLGPLGPLLAGLPLMNHANLYEFIKTCFEKAKEFGLGSFVPDIENRDLGTYDMEYLVGFQETRRRNLIKIPAFLKKRKECAGLQAKN